MVWGDADDVDLTAIGIGGGIHLAPAPRVDDVAIMVDHEEAGVEPRSTRALGEGSPRPHPLLQMASECLVVCGNPCVEVVVVPRGDLKVSRLWGVCGEGPLKVENRPLMEDGTTHSG